MRAQEPEPFLMAMSLHTLANHFAGGDIECCEQRRCPMAFVVVRYTVIVWGMGLNHETPEVAGAEAVMTAEGSLPSGYVKNGVG
jgi:hypothetical protein